MAELGLDVILRWPQPATGWSGAWVPSQRLRLGCGCESTRSEALDPWSVKGPWPSVLQRRISTKLESSKVSKVFIRRKKVQCLWINTQGDSQGESLSCTHEAV